MLGGGGVPDQLIIYYYHSIIIFQIELFYELGSMLFVCLDYALSFARCAGDFPFSLSLLTAL